MNVRNLVIGCALLFLLFVNTPMPVMTAQAPASGNLVLVPVMVSDSKNVPVSTLQQENFQVLEENKEQKIVQFSAATDPLTLSVVFGLSARGPVLSPGQKDRASVDILNSIERVREAHPAGSVNQSPFDSDGLFGVVSKSMDALGKQPGTKKALVVISDGLNSSGTQASNVPLPKALIESAKVAQFPIYFLYPTTSMSAPSFTENSIYATGYYLEQIAGYSGGRMITGQIENDLARMSAGLRDSLKNLYVLGYQSANVAKDGKWRKLAVKVTPPAGMSKLKVQTKSRYFVPKG